MAGRNIQPLRFNPRGVVDALDGGQVAPGGMTAATNLIFDPSNPFALTCRPAALKTFDFTGIAGAGVVSVSYVVGDICYGMIASSATATYDQPFAYNLETNALVTVSGTQDATTLPLTQTTAGKWTPPTMALVGVLLYVTHPGFVGGASAFFGWFDTTNPAAPVWNAGNTATIPLPSVPMGVSQFNNRAWFTCKNTLGFTDALTTTISDASHFLTIGDSEFITVTAPQPLITSVQGIIQSLAVFKAAVIALVTGDAALGNLAVNIISSSVGSSAPRTVAAGPKGLIFEAADGIRMLGQDGTLGEPNPDLKIPFIYSLTPSRDSACYNNNIYRITAQNGRANGNPLQEYWFDLRSNGWTGPHTFTQSMAAPYGNTVIAFVNSVAPGLFTSDVVQSGTSTFTEHGVALTFLEQTAPMQDDGGMYECSSVLSVIDLQVPQQAQTYTFTASDVNNGVLSIATLQFSNTGAIWNGFTWGVGVWTATSYGFERYNIPWTTALVFSRLVFRMTGESTLNLKIGKVTVGYQPLKYIRNFSA